MILVIRSKEYLEGERGWWFKEKWLNVQNDLHVPHNSVRYCCLHRSLVCLHILILLSLINSLFIVSCVLVSELPTWISHSISRWSLQNRLYTPNFYAAKRQAVTKGTALPLFILNSESSALGNQKVPRPHVAEGMFVFSWMSKGVFWLTNWGLSILSCSLCNPDTINACKNFQLFPRGVLPAAVLSRQQNCSFMHSAHCPVIKCRDSAAKDVLPELIWK